MSAFFTKTVFFLSPYPASVFDDDTQGLGKNVGFLYERSVTGVPAYCAIRVLLRGYIRAYDLHKDEYL